MTVPPQEWPTSTTSPSWLFSARWVAATSSASEVRGFCTTVTLMPSACSRGTTLAQSEPSAKAPWTITTEGCALAAWLPRVKSEVVMARARARALGLFMIGSPVCGRP
ncbi:hypothetical protein D3C85_1502300 [compost metagenome]